MVDQTVFNRVTLQLKRYRKNLAATRAKPMVILIDMIDQLNMTLVTVPSLGRVQKRRIITRRFFDGDCSRVPDA